MKKIICILLAIVGLFAFWGCSDGGKNDLETKQELVDLIQAYQDIYLDKHQLIESANADGVTDFQFILQDEVIITIANISSVTQVSDDGIVLMFDAEGSQSFANATAEENLGLIINIAVVRDDQTDTVYEYTVTEQISNGVFAIEDLSPTTITLLIDLIEVKKAENMLMQAAQSYNTKRAEFSSDAQYLPLSLPLPPQLVDCSNYLLLAEDAGLEIKG